MRCRPESCARAPPSFKHPDDRRERRAPQRRADPRQPAPPTRWKQAPDASPRTRWRICASRCATGPPHGPQRQAVSAASSCMPSRLRAARACRSVALMTTTTITAPGSTREPVTAVNDQRERGHGEVPLDGSLAGLGLTWTPRAQFAGDPVGGWPRCRTSAEVHSYNPPPWSRRTTHLPDGAICSTAPMQ